MTKTTTVGTAQPSPGYLYSLGVACVGVTCLGISVGGGLRARAGGNPMDALNVDGVVTFLLAFAIVFACRLIFFKGVSLAVRSSVRAAISMMLVTSVLATLLSIWLAAVSPDPHGLGLLVWFTTIAALCQIGSLIWLFYYRKQGLAG